jgi:hypothetical protein
VRPEEPPGAQLKEESFQDPYLTVESVKAPCRSEGAGVSRRTFMRSTLSTLAFCGAFIPLDATAAEPNYSAYFGIYQLASAGLGRGQYASILDSSLVMPAWAGTDEISSIAVEPLANHATDPSWITVIRPEKLTDLYSAVLTSCEWGRKPFSSDERTAFLDVVRKLYRLVDAKWQRTAEYDNYLTVKSTYEEAQKAWDATPPAARTITQKYDLDRAREVFQTLGDVADIQRNEGSLEHFLTYDYDISDRQPLLAAYHAAVKEGLTFRIYPAVRPLAGTPLWRSVQVDLDTTAPVNAPYGSTPASHALGLWRRSGQDTNPLPTPERISITAELAVAAIKRPWLAEEEIKKPVWRCPSAVVPTPLSWGAFPDPNPSSHPLTVLSTGVYFLRNVQIKAAWSAEVLAAIRTTSAPNAVGLGPLAIVGEFKGLLGPVVLQSYPAGQNIILVPNAQLIAVSTELLPRLPDPEADLTWNDPLPSLPRPTRSGPH